MRIACFDRYRVGVVEGDQIADVTAALPHWLDNIPKQRINWMIAEWKNGVESAVRSELAQASWLPVSSVQLLAPNPAPPHIFAAPANYQRHIGELGSRAVTDVRRSAREQGFFLKAGGSVVGPGEPLVLPIQPGRRFDHESELAVIVGLGGSNIPRSQAMKHVFGYSCLIDATMRIEKGVAEEERSMRKSFRGFTPMGPWITTTDEVENPSFLANRLSVNGSIRQDANTSDLIVGIAELVELISSVVDLQPGDVIATGTPEGVGPLAPGDEVVISIESVGEMTIQVTQADSTAPRVFGLPAIVN